MKRNDTLSCGRLGQEGLSFVIVGILLILGLQELDELVEARGDGCTWYIKVSVVTSWQGRPSGSGGELTKQRSNPVDPVSSTKIQGNQIRAKSPGWVEGTTCVVNTRQPIPNQSQSNSIFSFTTNEVTYSATNKAKPMTRAAKALPSCFSTAMK